MFSRCAAKSNSPHGVSLFLSEPATCEYVLVVSLKCQLHDSATYISNNNNKIHIAPQPLYELLALYRLTNAIKHTSICYLN